MIKYPEVQKKAQEEIDRVIGPYRLASFSDRSYLPYTDSIIAEVLRLRPPISVGRFGILSNKKGLVHTLCCSVSREAGEDDTHDGHLIEKGTVIIVNFW